MSKGIVRSGNRICISSAQHVRTPRVRRGLRTSSIAGAKKSSGVKGVIPFHELPEEYQAPSGKDKSYGS